MNKSESKYFNTAQCMNDALIALLNIKDLEYITVKEICARAGVNRSTFYLHYETIADLVNETAESINKRFLSYFKADTENLSDRINDKNKKDLVLINREYLLPYLNFIKDNKNIYRASFRNPVQMQAYKNYSTLKKEILEPIFKRFLIPEPRWQYYISYYIEGIMAIIKEWLSRDCADSVDTIAAIIEECVRPPADAEKMVFKA